MLRATIILILSLILSILCIISVFKNFLINFKKGGLIGLIIIILFVVALLCAVASYTSATTMQEVIDALKNPNNLPIEDIIKLRYSLAINTRIAVASIISGYILYAINMVLVKRAKRDVEAEYEKASSKTWKSRKGI